jgi:hypothetical protein
MVGREVVEMSAYHGHTVSDTISTLKCVILRTVARNARLDGQVVVKGVKE